MKRMVNLLCSSNGDPDDFESLSRDASARARDEAREHIEVLMKLRDDAKKALDKVARDDAFKDKQSKISEYSARVDEIWPRIEKLYADEIRGGNNPVLAFMRAHGQEAHSEYQEHSGYCTAKEVETGADRPADCVYADKCWVIEVKPNSNRAVDKGKGQAKDYADGLNSNKGGSFDKLVKANDKFASCKGKFEPKLATYVACPDLNDDGAIRSTSWGWSSPQ